MMLYNWSLAHINKKVIMSIYVEKCLLLNKMLNDLETSDEVSH